MGGMLRLFGAIPNVLLYLLKSLYATDEGTEHRERGLSAETRAALKARAERGDRSISAEVRRALRSYLTHDDQDEDEGAPRPPSQRYVARVVT
jgi:hypothetical protein